jgi:hypothetical protein
MKPAQYRDIPSGEIPLIELASAGKVKVIAGAFEHDGRLIEGPVNRTGAKITTDAGYLDVHLPPGAEFLAPVSAGHTGFLYAYEGGAQVGASGEEKALPHRAAGVLSAGECVRVVAKEQGARFLLLTAKPLHEPVVQYGPFVMNTREEIEQAVADYREGRLAA